MSCYLTVCQTQQSAQHFPNLSSFLPAIFASAWRDRFQLFLQITLQPSSIMTQEGRGIFSNIGCFGKGRMETGRIPPLPLMTHLSLQHVFKTGLKLVVYLRAVILKQTCRWRTQHQRKHHRPVLMSTHSSDDKGEVSDYRATTHLHVSKINRQSFTS